VRDGWIWWIPFADGTDSVGCVLHAKVVKERGGSMEALFDEVLATSPRLTQGLAPARRLTPVHTAANYSYLLPASWRPLPAVVMPFSVSWTELFCRGLHAMRSAELAAEAAPGLPSPDFSASALRPYAARLHHWGCPILL
jgi:halogenation protein CepH